MSYETNGHRNQQFGGQTSDLAVMDAQEYKQKHRLRRILESLDRVEDRRDEAEQLFVSGQIQAEGVEVITLESVKRAIRECYSLLRGYTMDLDEHEVDRYWVGDPNDPIGVLRFDETDETITFVGLRDILGADKFYSTSWTETVSPRNRPKRVEEYSEDKAVPERVSWSAYLRLREFLADETALSLSFEANEQDATADPF